MASFSEEFLAEAGEILCRLEAAAIERLVALLVQTRQCGGRLFILGVGGSAANASHAVNDFRKIAGMEAYAPTDNVSELTARTNDEGWAGVFESWLRVSRLRTGDAVLVLSVGGGDAEHGISPNLVAALDYARRQGAAIGGIVGRNGGHTARVADACVIVPTVNTRHITPHTEAFQAVVWHLVVSHPALKQTETKWESVATQPHRAAVFLDRDGVLNRPVIRDGKPYPPPCAAQVDILPEAAEALAALKQRGFLLIVVTNQPDVRRGTQTRDEVERIHGVLRAALPIDDVFVCYHDESDACACRKPKPGLLYQAAARHTIDLAQSFLVGDRWRDVEAGHNAGCRTVWIDYGYAEKSPALPPSARVQNLRQAVDWILAQSALAAHRTAT